ncbi:DUF1552 domain-containing protein [Stieleria varia]|uniref:DUF1552 domain-containing protein n=1 Tax=Stieleria varia TaxID=2528005 RepID=A0A5C6B779_9BACT|nr:DUF1552 domain-containing protein [Stieleria varia]TWU07893.1 hypothetical protein Pla52n_04690 [Stieleria varia]
MKNSWQLSRRSVFRAAGVSMALPWLEAMGAPSTALQQQLPRRMCAILFPFGIAMPKDDAEDRQWGWFPTGKGKDYQLTNVLQPLQPLMDNVSIFSGLSHPRCRAMNGHDTGDTFLTANHLAPVTYQNTISLDQYAASQIGQETRLASLTLSTDGGVGPRTRTTTLSYTDKGQPIPALSDPKQIFERLFGQDGASKQDQSKLQNSASILDLVMDQSKSLQRKLGAADQRKLSEFETSVREVEHRIERASNWLNIPLPEVDRDSIDLDATIDAPREYLKAIYDLQFLAFQTDLTRISTYQIGSYGPSRARTFPAALGLKPDWHGLAHAAGKKGGPENIGRFDQFLAENLARFLTRLQETPEGDGNMLDRTLVLYGSSNSRTHQNHNYPLLLAGGGGLGLRHNQFLHFDEKTPMSNLFVTMLQALGMETESFVDSTGSLDGLT